MIDREETRDKMACFLCGALQCDFKPMLEAIECPQHLERADSLVSLIVADDQTVELKHNFYGALGLNLTELTPSSKE